MKKKTKEKSLLNVMCGNKEKVVREWFIERYGDLSAGPEVFPQEKTIDLIPLFQQDVEGCDVSYGLFNAVLKKIAKEMGVKKQTASIAIKKGVAQVPAESVEEVNVDPVSLGEMQFPNFKRHISGKLIDKIMSDLEPEGGAYGGTVNIVVGESGAGKTTILLDYIKTLKKKDPTLKVAYASSEMTRNDLSFALKKSPELKDVPVIILNDYLFSGQLAAALTKIFSSNYDLIILDSYEDTVIKLKEFLNWQKTYAASWLINKMVDAAEKQGAAVFAIQHLNKDGNYAGGTFLKHATTAMMEIRIAEDGRRYVQFAKNRRGGSMVFKPVMFSLNKQTGDVEYDVTEFEQQEKANQIVDLNELRIRELNSTFGATFKLFTEENQAAPTKTEEVEEDGE